MEDEWIVSARLKIMRDGGNRNHLRETKGSALDTGQIQQVIENSILPASANNTRLAFTPFGRSRLIRDFASPTVIQME